MQNTVTDDWKQLWSNYKFTILAGAIVVVFIRMLERGPAISAGNAWSQGIISFIVGLIISLFLHWLFHLGGHKYAAWDDEN
jgi:hypothetical protein